MRTKKRGASNCPHKHLKSSNSNNTVGNRDVSWFNEANRSILHERHPKDLKYGSPNYTYENFWYEGKFSQKCKIFQFFEKSNLIGHTIVHDRVCNFVKKKATFTDLQSGKSLHTKLGLLFWTLNFNINLTWLICKMFSNKTKETIWHSFNYMMLWIIWLMMEEWPGKIIKLF